MMLDDMKLDETGGQERLTRPALAMELADRLPAKLFGLRFLWKTRRAWR